MQAIVGSREYKHNHENPRVLARLTSTQVQVSTRAPKTFMHSLSAITLKYVQMYMYVARYLTQHSMTST